MGNSRQAPLFRPKNFLLLFFPESAAESWPLPYESLFAFCGHEALIFEDKHNQCSRKHRLGEDSHYHHPAWGWTKNEAHTGIKIGLFYLSKREIRLKTNRMLQNQKVLKLGGEKKMGWLPRAYRESSVSQSGWTECPWPPDTTLQAPAGRGWGVLSREGRYSIMHTRMNSNNLTSFSCGPTARADDWQPIRS